MAKNCLFRIVLLCFWACLSAPLMAELGDDLLKTVWSDTKESDADRFAAINAYYQKTTLFLPDSTLALSIYHYDLAKEKNVQIEMNKALKERARALSIIGEFDSALVILEVLVGNFTAANDSIALARIHNNIGTLHYYRGQYQEAVRYYSWSLSVLEAKSMDTAVADVVNNLGLIYYEIQNYDLSLEYLERARMLYEELQLEGKRGNIWLNIGTVYFEVGDCEGAMDYSRKAIPIFKVENNLPSKADCYSLMAHCFKKTGALDSAFYYVEQSLILNLGIGNPVKIIQDKILIANLTFASDVDAAIQMGEELLVMTQQVQGPDLKKNVYDLLYQCYNAKGQFQKALEMHEQFSRYQDSLRIQENNIAVIREAIETEFEIKLYENQQKNEQDRAKLELDQLKKTFTIVAFGILMILVILLYARSRIRSHRHQRKLLLSEIEQLKNADETSLPVPVAKFHLDREKIEISIEKKLNETDWNVLNILLDNPVISNKGIAEVAHMSIDGIGSSLRRMYVSFEIKESKYKKISLLMEAIKLSNKQNTLS